MLRSKVRLFWFALSTPSQSVDEESARSNLVSMLVDTGGQLSGLSASALAFSTKLRFDANPDSLNALRARVALLHALVAEPYKLEFNLDAPITKPVRLKIKVITANPQESKAFEAVCPRYIVPN